MTEWDAAKSRAKTEATGTSEQAKVRGEAGVDKGKDASARQVAWPAGK